MLHYLWLITNVTWYMIDNQWVTSYMIDNQCVTSYMIDNQCQWVTSYDLQPMSYMVYD